MILSEYILTALEYKIFNYHMLMVKIGGDQKQKIFMNHYKIYSSGVVHI